MWPAIMLFVTNCPVFCFAEDSGVSCGIAMLIAVLINSLSKLVCNNRRNCHIIQLWNDLPSGPPLRAYGPEAPVPSDKGTVWDGT